MLNKKFSLRNRFTRFEGDNLPGKRRKRIDEEESCRKRIRKGILFEKEERRKKKGEEDTKGS